MCFSHIPFICFCSRSVHAKLLSCSLQPHGPQPSRLLCPWDFPGKNTGVGCPALLWGSSQPRDQTWVFCTGRRILYHWHHLWRVLGYPGNPKSLIFFNFPLIHAKINLLSIFFMLRIEEIEDSYKDNWHICPSIFPPIHPSNQPSIHWSIHPVAAFNHKKLIEQSRWKDLLRQLYYAQAPVIGTKLASTSNFVSPYGRRPPSDECSI